MPAPIHPDIVKKFDAMLALGHTVASARRECGVSQAWAYDRSKGRKKRDQAKFYATLNDDAKQVRPKTGDKLKPEAQQALEDFAYFRLRYTGRSSVPWQVDAANQMVKMLESPDKEYVVVNAPPGGGKALALDTPILTTRGWTTMKDVEPGDEVYGADGRPTAVVAKSEVFYDHDCYEVRSDDGASVVADAAHLWSVRLHGHGQYGNWQAKPDYAGKTGPKASPDGRHIHTTEFLAKPRTKRPQVQVAEPLDFPDAPLLIDPYVLGVWLGDGNSAGARFTSHPDDAPFVTSQIEQAGYAVERMAEMRYSVTGSRKWARDGLHSHLRQLALLDNKHVPEQYLMASAPQRLALLQGLVDTDGHVDAKGRVEFTSTKRALADGVLLLARSLGVKASLKIGRATIEGRDCGEKYRVSFQHPQAARLPRKAERCRAGVRTPSRYLTVTRVESVPTQCIQVAAADGLFLAGEGLLVTHNSTLFTHDIPLWLICRNRSIRILIGSATQRQATLYTNRLRRSLQATKPHMATDDELARGMRDALAAVSTDFGRFKPDSQNPDVWRAEEFSVAQVDNVSAADKEHTVTAFGKEGGVLGNRVDFCIWDDLIDERNLRTVEAREEMKRWWQSTAETRIDPRGVMVLQGQRMGSDDLYAFALEMKDVVLDDDGVEDVEVEAPTKYRHIVYKAHYEDKCEGKHPRQMEPWPASCLLDPYNLPWRELARTQKNGMDSYRVQYQQESAELSSVLVKKVWVTGGQDEHGQTFFGCWDGQRGTWELPPNLPGEVFVYATVDPSPTRWWGCQVWAYHPQSERFFLLDLVRQRMQMADFLDWDADTGELRGLAVDWQHLSERLGHRITTWIVEKNAAQQFFFTYTHTERFKQKFGIQLVPHVTASNKNDPKYGVQALGPLYRDGRVRLPGRQNDGSRLASLKLVDEVTKWPHGTSDDQVMSQWFGFWALDRLYTPQQEPPRIHGMWTPSHRGLELVG